MGVGSLLAGWLYDRFKAVVVLVPSAILVSGALGGLALVTEHTPLALIVVAHVSLSVGVAFLYTPLVPAALGSLSRHLYAHGSAVVGTVEQIAGAAGTALFVTIMATQSVGLQSHGIADAASAAGGVRAAFFVGMLVSLPAIAAAFFIRKPADQANARVVG